MMSAFVQVCRQGCSTVESVEDASRATTHSEGLGYYESVSQISGIVIIAHNELEDDLQ